ncbi:MAG TPA: peptidylprolyl isomerase [Blastocatellia bacterium]|nr:peptidylprolyl isomerase [Blastocatellia bacterium]
MTTKFFQAATTLLLLSTLLAAQAPPVTVPSRKPTLKRDRTQRVLYPKIIQYEDERWTPQPNDLLDLLQAGHGGARRRAMLALARIGYPSGLSGLIDVLNADRNAENRDPEMRALAAFALGEIESQHAASYLVQHLDPAAEPSVLVRARCAEALGKIASNKVSAAALGDYGVKGIADALAALLPSPEKPFVSETHKLLVELTLTALLRVRQPTTVEAITTQLRSPDPDIRWQAANALARIRDGIQAAVPQLLPLLEDTNALVRAHAARALGVAKAPQAVDGLIKRLGDTDQRVTASAIGALGAIGEAKAVEPLVALGNGQLADYRAFDRNKAGVPPQQNLLLLIATALGQIKDARALPFLKSLRLADGRLGAFPEVEVAVARFGEKEFFDVPDAVKLTPNDWRAMAAYAQGLGQLANDRARAALLDMFNGKSYGKPDPRAVSPLLQAMEAAKVEGLRDILLEQLKADDVVVRATSAELLGELGDPGDKVTNALEAAYKAARKDVMNDARVAIVEAAAKLKHPINLQVLAEETRDEDYVVRRKAYELLAQSKFDMSSQKVMLGKVNTGHDKSYWQRMAQLAESRVNPVAVIHTKKGDIRIELYAQDAPMTVDNFVTLARKGFYNGLEFVRVVPNFVIQGGDSRGDQNGGPGYQIRDEINLRRYGVGTVGMALSGKDTGGSQFFITHSPQPHLDGGYTVFGQVTDGMDAVNRIARGDKIERVEIIEPK